MPPATSPLTGQRRPGHPVVTRRTTGAGSAGYVSTRLGRDGLTRLLPRLLAPAVVESELPEKARGRVEATVRTAAGSRYLFLVNRTDDRVTVPGLAGEALVGEAAVPGAFTAAPRGVTVLRQPAG
ncbi:Beta-galactosidase C-terminal domain [Streptomyces sp. NPDC054802]